MVTVHRQPLQLRLSIDVPSKPPSMLTLPLNIKQLISGIAFSEPVDQELNLGPLKHCTTVNFLRVKLHMDQIVSEENSTYRAFCSFEKFDKTLKNLTKEKILLKGYLT